MGITIVGEIIGILVSGLQSFGSGLGSAIQAIITSMFIDVSGANPTLSVFASVICAFGSIALAVGITRRIFTWLITLGGRK